MGTVHFRTTSDIRELERDNEKLLRQNAKLLESNRKLVDESKRGEQEQRKSADNTAQSIRQIGQSIRSTIMSYVSLGTIVQAVTRDFEEQKRVAAEALTTQTQVAKAQETAIKNLAGLSRQQRQDVIALAPEISQRAEFADVNQIVTALGAGISAGGKPSTVVSAVTEAAKVTRQSPEELAATAGAAIDIAGATKIDDATRTLGFLLSSAAQARAEDPLKFARYVAPTVRESLLTVPEQAREQAAKEAGALFGEISKIIGDTTGERTRTVQRDLIMNLREVFKEEGPTTLFKRLEEIRADPELREQFLKDASKESRLAIEALTTREGMRGLEQARGQISFDAARFRELAEETRAGTPQLRLATAGEAQETLIKRFELSDVEGRTAQARKALTDVYSKTRGAYFYGSRLVSDALDIAEFDFTRLEPESKVAGLFRQRAREIGQAFPVEAGRPERIQKMIDLLIDSARLQEKNLEELRSINKNMVGVGAAAQIGRHNEQ